MDSHWTPAVTGTTGTGGTDILVAGSRFRERKHPEARSASAQGRYRRPCIRPDTTLVQVLPSLRTLRTSVCLPSSTSNSNNYNRDPVQDSRDRDWRHCTRAPLQLHPVVPVLFYYHLLIITTHTQSLITRELHSILCTQMLSFRVTMQGGSVFVANVDVNRSSTWIPTPPAEYRSVYLPRNVIHRSCCSVSCSIQPDWLRN